ncbi:MAG: hypothetical protein RL477_583 [Pseudomonadota bacterium]|jgi:hypothetical protein
MVPIRFIRSSLIVLAIAIGTGVSPVLTGGPVAAQDGDTYVVVKKKPEAPPATSQTVTPIVAAPPGVVDARPNTGSVYIGAASGPSSGEPVYTGPSPGYVGAASGAASGPAVNAGVAPNLAARVMERKLGSEGFQRFIGQLETMKTEAGTGRGAPMADRWFDNAAPRTGDDRNLKPAGTPAFGIGGAAPPPPPVPVTEVRGTFKPATVRDAAAVTKTYGSIPGGVVLEGVVGGLGSYGQVVYDRRFNAFILDNRVVYFIKVPPRTVSVMSSAIAKDDLVGVSLGDTQIVYGKVPENSELANDLKLADHFLGGIVFAQGHWTEGYRFPNNYMPKKKSSGGFSMAVFFNFNGFQFRVAKDELVLSGVNFDVRLLPLSQTKSRDGGHLPDETAIAQGRTVPEYESNVRHLTDNIGYYRREEIIERMFSYGEVAAFLRGLKAAGFDLEALSRSMITS